MNKAQLKKEYRKWVMDYAEEHNMEPLFLKPEYQKKMELLYNKLGIESMKKNSEERKDIIDRLIINLLAYCYIVDNPSGSYARPNSQLETSSGRRRSVIDIYRHLLSIMNVKHYNDRKNPISIFDVMLSLYRIWTNGSIEINKSSYALESNFCSVVERAVFYLSKVFWKVSKRRLAEDDDDDHESEFSIPFSHFRYV